MENSSHQKPGGKGLCAVNFGDWFGNVCMRIYIYIYIFLCVYISVHLMLTSTGVILWGGIFFSIFPFFSPFFFLFFHKQTFFYSFLKKIQEPGV